MNCRDARHFCPYSICRSYERVLKAISTLPQIPPKQTTGFTYALQRPSSFEIVYLLWANTRYYFCAFRISVGLLEFVYNYRRIGGIRSTLEKSEEFRVLSIVHKQISSTGRLSRVVSVYSPFVSFINIDIREPESTWQSRMLVRVSQPSPSLQPYFLRTSEWSIYQSLSANWVLRQHPLKYSLDLPGYCLKWSLSASMANVDGVEAKIFSIQTNIANAHVRLNRSEEILNSSAIKS